MQHISNSRLDMIVFHSNKKVAWLLLLPTPLAAKCNTRNAMFFVWRHRSPLTCEIGL